jgi:transcriptional antiterminator NusG
MLQAQILTRALWYAVFTYHNAEKRVKEYINSLAKDERYKGLIIRAEVPTQKKIVSRGKKIKQIEEKMFPGYVFVKAVMTPEVMSAIRRINGVAHFVGSGNMPEPITPAEIKRAGITDTANEEFKAGDIVMIIDGPFENFTGQITGINNSGIKVCLSMFGREVEIDFSPEQLVKV